MATFKFHESSSKTYYSTVMSGIMFLILLLIMINFGLAVKVVDLETVFLYGMLKEDNYMECPSGMKDIHWE